MNGEQHYAAAELLAEMATEGAATDYLHEMYLLAKAQVHATLALAAVNVRTCRICGCTDERSCQVAERSGCAWVEPREVKANLCTACAP